MFLNAVIEDGKFQRMELHGRYEVLVLNIKPPHPRLKFFTKPYVYYQIFFKNLGVVSNFLQKEIDVWNSDGQVHHKINGTYVPDEDVEQVVKSLTKK